MTDLKPGPELDALVAEKVMGWKRLESPSGDYAPWEDDKGKRRNTWVAARSFAGLLEWSPSTDIAAAWEVVEKLNESVLFVTVELKPGSGARALCQIIDISKQLRSIHYGESAPEAICRAALEYTAAAALEAVGHDSA